MVPTGPVTEVAILGLKPGVDLENESSPEYQVSREAISVISSQDGFQNAYYGHHLEDRSKLDLVIGACFQCISREACSQVMSV